MKYGVGQPVMRFEDTRLLRGEGHFQDDLTLPRQAYAVFLRSPHAHARIAALDTAAAAARAGRARRLHRGGFCRRRPRQRSAAMPRKKRPTARRCSRAHRPASLMTACAMSAIPSRWSSPRRSTQAKDAAELDRPRLSSRSPSVTATADAAEPGSAPGLGRMPRQRLPCLRARQQGGDRGRLRPRRACRSSAATSSPASMRNSWSRAARIGVYEPRDERFTLYADVQYPHRVRDMLANMRLQGAGDQIRVVAATSAAASASRAGNMPSIAWRSGPRASSAAR